MNGVNRAYGLEEQGFSLRGVAERRVAVLVEPPPASVHTPPLNSLSRHVSSDNIPSRSSLDSNISSVEANNNEGSLKIKILTISAIGGYCPENLAKIVDFILNCFNVYKYNLSKVPLDSMSDGKYGIFREFNEPCPRYFNYNKNTRILLYMDTYRIVLWCLQIY